MIIDATAVPEGGVLEGATCVVGAGPAGIALATSLARRGLDVLMLETGTAEPSHSSQVLAGGQSVGAPYFPIEETRTRAVGGTSHTWPWIEGWRARPLDPIDFERRAGLPFSGWPFGPEALEPFMAEAHALCDLDPAVYEARHWLSPGEQLLPLQPPVETAVFRYSRTSFTRFHDDLERERRIRLVTGATVTRINVPAERDAVTSLACTTSGLRRFTVRAERYVLAGGGIENPRLLLLSGLNRHDLVGRFFMERITVRAGVAAWMDDDWSRRLGFYGIHRVDDHGVQGVLTLAEDVKRREGLRNAAFFVEPGVRSASADALRSAATIVRARRRRPRPPLLANARAVAADPGGVASYVRHRLGGPDEPVLVLRAQAEPSPDPQSRIRLGRRRDPLGQPAAVLDWRPPAADRDSVRRTVELLGEALRRAGIAHLEHRLGDEDPPAVLEGAHHHLGTTRMDPDPLRGVVDGDCRVHGLANLYVAGSSVFPAAGYANPTLTLVALACRLADHLAGRA
jgi:choline dehydrogenase-like flavoprotein